MLFSGLRKIDLEGLTFSFYKLKRNFKKAPKFFLCWACSISTHLFSVTWVCVKNDSGDQPGLFLKLILPTIGGTKMDGKKMLSWALPCPSLGQSSGRRGFVTSTSQMCTQKRFSARTKVPHHPNHNATVHWVGSHSPSLSAEVISPFIKSHQTDNVLTILS